MLCKGKLAGLIVVLAALCLATTTSAVAGPLFPTVTSAYHYFNDGSVSGYDFIYTVTHIGGTNAYNFGYLQVDTAMASAGGTNGWVLSGPFINGAGNDLNWTRGTIPGWYDQNDVEYTSAFWRASSSQEVLRNQTWIGVFTLRVPDCVPVKGDVLTKDGVIASTNVTSDLDVPGVPVPDVPEPGSLLAFVTGMVGLSTFVRRRARG